MDDRELINLYLDGGDISAFNALVRKQQKPIFNFILKMVGNREDAADLSQQVFIRCFKSLRRLKDRSRFAPWLYRIAVNSVHDHYRRRKEVYSLDDDSVNAGLRENLTDGGVMPSEYAEASQRAELVKAALKRIPEEQREVVILKIYQGLKFTEIAEALDTPLNTVKSRLYYGMNAIKKIFKEMKLKEFSHDEL